MSATAAPHSRAFDVSGTAPVPFGRLVGVEVRKMADTRAGAWLLAIIAVVTVALIIALFALNDAEDRTFYGFLSFTATPQMVLLPVLAILLVTGEWGQRTTLTTFALVPSRGKVVAAKVVAALAFGLAAIAFAAVVSALAATVGGAADPFGEVTGAAMGNFVLLQVLGVLQGLAIGLLVLNSAGAIVLFFAAPIVVNLVTSFWPWFRERAEWVDLAVAQGPLYDAQTLTGTEWTNLAVVCLWWIVVPAVVGLVRVLRSEVK